MTRIVRRGNRVEKGEIVVDYKYDGIKIIEVTVEKEPFTPKMLEDAIKEPTILQRLTKWWKK